MIHSYSFTGAPPPPPTHTQKKYVIVIEKRKNVGTVLKYIIRKANTGNTPSAEFCEHYEELQCSLSDHRLSSTSQRISSLAMWRNLLECLIQPLQPSTVMSSQATSMAASRVI